MLTLYLLQIDSLCVPQRKVCSSFRIIRNILTNTVGMTQQTFSYNIAACIDIYIYIYIYIYIERERERARARGGGLR